VQHSFGASPWASLAGLRLLSRLGEGAALNLPSLAPERAGIDHAREHDESPAVAPADRRVATTLLCDKADDVPGDSAVVAAGEGSNRDAVAVAVDHLPVAEVQADVEHVASGCVGEADRVAGLHLGEVAGDGLAT